MEEIVIGDLRIAPSESSGPVAQYVWSGRSNDRHPARALAPFFQLVLATAKESGRRVEMHFQKVEHLNSSTISAIVQFIQVSRDKGVPLALVYDEARKWQKLSFDALRAFVKGDALFDVRAV
jgi:hypothetical protein